MFSNRRTFALRSTISVVTATFAIACSSSDASSDATSSGALASNRSNDSSDTNCQIVLRSANRKAGTQGPVELDHGQFVWNAYVDVSDSALADGSTPSLHVQFYRDDWTPYWSDVQGKATTSSGGFTTYLFEFAELSPESSAINVSGDVVFIPFLTKNDGSRLFDHNRGNGNYVLSYAGNRFKIDDDSSVCR